MNKIKATYEILTSVSEGGIRELQHIEKIGRVCYKSEDYITEDGESAKKFVAMLIRNGHEAMIEHSFLSVKFTVDRGVSHELVRHRIASFAQESTRYCNYAKDKFGAECAFIDLEPGIMLDNKMKKMSAEEIALVLAEWKSAMEDAERHYMKHHRSQEQYCLTVQRQKLQFLLITVSGATSSNYECRRMYIHK